MHVCLSVCVCACACTLVTGDCKLHISSNWRQCTGSRKTWVLVIVDSGLKPGFECCVTQASHLPFLGFISLSCEMRELDKISGSQNLPTPK